MKTLQYLTLCLCLGACLSCTEIIPIDVPAHSPELVLNATFCPDSTWTASLTQSQQVSSLDTPLAVTNGSITIWEGSRQVDSLIHDRDDLYRSGTGHRPDPGIIYTVRASAPGFNTVTGSDYAPEAVLPYAVAWQDTALRDENGRWLGRVGFSIDDPAHVANYYILNSLWVDPGIQFIDPTIIVGYDYILESLSLPYQLLFQDRTFNGKKRSIYFYTPTERRPNILFILQLSTVSENYYMYTKTLSASRTASFNPFAEPVRVHSNMNTGMGIFAGYSTQLVLIPL